MHPKFHDYRTISPVEYGECCEFITKVASIMIKSKADVAGKMSCRLGLEAVADTLIGCIDSGQMKIERLPNGRLCLLQLDKIKNVYTYPKIKSLLEFFGMPRMYYEK